MFWYRSLLLRVASSTEGWYSRQPFQACSHSVFFIEFKATLPNVFILTMDEMTV